LTLTAQWQERKKRKKENMELAEVWSLWNFLKFGGGTVTYTVLMLPSPPLLLTDSDAVIACPHDRWLIVTM